MKDLSRRQQAILQYIEHFLDENDYPPTIRDIQTELGISSTSVVDYNLKALEARGHIRRNSKISRGIELVNRVTGRRNVVTIPVIGQIAAGLPIPVPGDLEGSDVTETVELGPLAVTGALFRAGVGVLAGTDAPLRNSPPGFGLHEELLHLTQAGLTPFEALRAATYEPARFLGALDSLGTVEVGKLADLVLLTANPVTDIRNSSRTAYVITNGRVHVIRRDKQGRLLK